MIQYSGAVQKITGISGSTRQNLINAIVDQLEVCGWTVTSGEGTATVVLRSGLTPQGLRMKIKIHSNVAAGVCGFAIMNDAESRTSVADQYGGGFLRWGTAYTYTMIASPYQVYITGPGISTQEMVFFGSLWQPSFITGVTNCMFIVCDAATDSGVSIRGLKNYLVLGSGCAWATITNDVLCDNRNDTAWRAGAPQIVYPLPGDLTNGDNTNIMAWITGQIPLWDPLVSWSPNNNRDSEGRIMGSLWDAAVISDFAAPIDATLSFDNHNWQLATMPVSNSSAIGRGQLIFATS